MAEEHSYLVPEHVKSPYPERKLVGCYSWNQGYYTDLKARYDILAAALARRQATEFQYRAGVLRPDDTLEAARRQREIDAIQQQMLLIEQEAMK
jgi:hypothetical protein